VLRQMTALLLPLPPPTHLFCWRFTGLRTGRGARTRLPEGARIVGQKPSATRERQTALKAPEKPAIPTSQRLSARERRRRAPARRTAERDESG
jgi:hypothetical protein